MKIEYLGHSCFKIIDENNVLIIDPYVYKSVPGYKKLNEKANQVICSHKHKDHSGINEIEIKPKDYFNIETISTYHDNHLGKDRGLNNIIIVNDKIAHLGDLGCDLNDDQVSKLKNIDILLIPVGGYYTIDGLTAASIVKKINPKICIPMHYRKNQLGYNEISEVNDFLSYFNNILYLDDYKIDTNHNYPHNIIVLNPYYGEDYE